MPADLDAERLALPGVADAGVAAGAYEAGGAGGHGEPALVEREHRDLEPLTFASHQVLGRHFHVVQLEEAGVAREDAPLLRERAAREPRESALDDERAHAGWIALLLLGLVGPRE